VPDRDVAERQHVRLRHVTLDDRVLRQWPERRRVVVTPDRREHRRVDVAERAQDRAEARRVVEDGAERHVDDRAVFPEPLAPGAVACFG
jgi:hypothetical protein